jgi:hypothetical protein
VQFINIGTGNRLSASFGMLDGEIWFDFGIVENNETASEVYMR